MTKEEVAAQILAVPVQHLLTVRVEWKTADSEDYAMLHPEQLQAIVREWQMFKPIVENLAQNLTAEK